MVAAPRPGLTVRVEPMSAQGYVGAVRPVPARGPATKADADTERPGHRPRPSTEADSGPAGTMPSPSATSSPRLLRHPRRPSSSAPATTPSPAPSDSLVVARARSGAVLVDPELDPTATPLPTEDPGHPQLTIVATLTPGVVRISVLPTVPTRGTR